MTPTRALLVHAIALAPALQGARAMVPAAGPARALAAQGAPATVQAEADETLAFRAIRAAEVAGDAGRLGAWTNADQPARVRARAALALETARRRGAARTVAEAVAAERGIESMRAALIAKFEADAPAAARELSLESAEDLLLREHAIPLGDTTLAIGLPSVAEWEEARALLAAVGSRLGSALVSPALQDGAPIATDPAVFRAHALKGLAAVLAADLAQCEAEGLVGAADDQAARAAARRRADEARAEAVRLLARASLCELPVPEALGDILALARGRVERDAALRERLLSRAADSRDPATALAARVTRWRDGGGRRPFPRVGTDGQPLDALARVACAAELRAGVPSGGDALAAAAAVEQALRRAGAESSDPTESIKRRRATATWFAERLPRELRVVASRADAPPALVAVAALGPDGATLLESAPDALARAAADSLLGPLVALRVAEWRAARGETGAAADSILSAVRAFAGMPSAREAIEIALEIRRTQNDDARLDEALALAIERFAADPAAFGWRCERIDLALFGRDGVRDLDRAATLLRAAARRDLSEAERNNVYLRQIELEVARLSGGLPWDEIAARTDLVGQFIEIGKTAMAFDVQSLPAIDPTASPAHVRTMPARMSVVRAEIAVVTGDAIKARILAERGLADPFVDEGSAVRAARIWILASLASGEAFRAPPQLRGVAARSASLREWTAEPLARLVDGAESAIAEGTQPRDPPGAIDTLAQLLSAGSARPSASTLRAQAFGRLAALDREKAAALAREAVEADPDDRRSRWVLAEALRGQPSAEARNEAFEIFRSLAPLSAPERDRYWWRAQLAQLELVSARTGRDRNPADIVGRVNRLEALDPVLGGPALAKRFEALRAKALEDSAASSGVGGQGDGRTTAAD